MLLTVMDQQGSLIQLLPQLLFVVYNVIALTSFNGKTIGKYFARLSVRTEEGGGALYLGLRETAKLLYVLPNVGVLFLLFSGVLTVLFKKTLHDWFGNTCVLLDTEQKESGDTFEDRLIR